MNNREVQQGLLVSITDVTLCHPPKMNRAFFSFVALVVVKIMFEEGFTVPDLS